MTELLPVQAYADPVDVVFDALPRATTVRLEIPFDRAAWEADADHELRVWVWEAPAGSQDWQALVPGRVIRQEHLPVEKGTRLPLDYFSVGCTHGVDHEDRYDRAREVDRSFRIGGAVYHQRVLFPRIKVRLEPSVSMRLGLRAETRSRTPIDLPQEDR